MDFDKFSFNDCRIKVFNIVLYPESAHYDSFYTELFNRLFEEQFLVQTYGNRVTCIRNIEETAINDNVVLYGKLSNTLYRHVPQGLSVKKYWFPEEELGNLIKEKLWDFVFVPQYHRLAVIEPFSWRQVNTFLNKSIDYYLNERHSIMCDSFSVNIEKNRDVIERILHSQAISRLEIQISYTNNDNHDEWEKVIDNELRKSHAKTSKIILNGTKLNPIRLFRSNMLQALVKLSSSNGYTEATVYDNQNFAEKISTKNHPLVQRIHCSDSPIHSIYSIIQRLASKHYE